MEDVDGTIILELSDHSHRNFFGGTSEAMILPKPIKKEELQMQNALCHINTTDVDLDCSRDPFEGISEAMILPKPVKQEELQMQNALCHINTTDVDLNCSRDLFEGTSEAMILPTPIKKEELQMQNALCHINTTDVYIDCSRNPFEDTEIFVKDGPISCKRVIKICTLCNRKTRYLSNHLKSHNLCKDEILHICYIARKQSSSKYGNCGRKCPFPNCNNANVHQRLDHHLLKKHKLNYDDPLYRRYIRKINISKTSNDSRFSRSDNGVSKNIVIEQECSKFKEHLTQRLDGSLNIMNAKQHSYKLQQILVGVHFQSVADISKPTFIDSLQHFMDEFAKSHAGLSCVTYLCVLSTYLLYLKKRKILESSLVDDLICQIKPLKKSYRKENPSSIHALQQEILTDDIFVFENSDLYKEVLGILKNGEILTTLSITEHAKIRGVLLLMAIFRNSCRSCALINMAIEELKQALPVKNKFGETDFIIDVKDHKTVLTHGMAGIVLSEDIYGYFLFYMTKIRKLIPAVPEHNAVFVTWSGKQLTADDLSKTIQRTWTFAGLKSKIGTTLFRKTFTTVTHRENNQSKNEAPARHLCHNVTTASRYYKLRTVPIESVLTARAMRKSLGGQCTLSSNDCIEEETFKDCSLTPQQSTSIELEENNTSSKRPKGQCFYDQVERNIIKTVFSDHIELCKVPKLGTIRGICETNFNFQNWPHDKLNPVKIKGAIQSMVNKELKHK